MRIDIDADGTIARITPASPPDGAVLLNGPVVAGMPNAHSHAFQRAFAGRAERSVTGDDSFWTWRRAMYGLAQRITPTISRPSPPSSTWSCSKRATRRR